MEEIEAIKEYAEQNGFIFEVFWGEYFLFKDEDGIEYKTKLNDEQVLNLLCGNEIELTWYC